MSNRGNILVQENFLPSSFHNELLQIVDKENSFPWFFLEHVSGIKSNDSYKQYGFSHILYDKKDEFYSQYFNIFYPIKFFIESKFNLRIKEMLRFRLGLNLNISENKSIVHSAHRDFNFDHYVFLYYLNECDGSTIFYLDNKEIEVEPSANKAVLFDGSIFHSSSTPVNYSKRIALNINFILEK